MQASEQLEDEQWENGIPEELPRNYSEEDIILLKKELYELLVEIENREEKQEKYNQSYNNYIKQRKEELEELKSDIRE